MRIGGKVFYFILLFGLTAFLFSCASSPKTSDKIGEIPAQGDDLMSISYNPSERNLTSPQKDEITPIEETKSEEGEKAQAELENGEGDTSQEIAANTQDGPQSSLNGNGAQSQTDGTPQDLENKQKDGNLPLAQNDNSFNPNTFQTQESEGSALSQDGLQNESQDEEGAIALQNGEQAGAQNSEDSFDEQKDGEELSDFAFDDAAEEKSTPSEFDDFIDTPISEMNSEAEEEYDEEELASTEGKSEDSINALGGEGSKAAQDAAYPQAQITKSEEDEIKDSGLGETEEEVFDDSFGEEGVAKAFEGEGDFLLDGASEKSEYIGPKFSREVTAKRNDLIEVQYPGSGWAYQENIDSSGETDLQNNNFLYKGRKLGGKAQTFILQALREGEYMLHFYKMDNVTGVYIDDWLKVCVQGVGNAVAAKTVRAPLYEEVEPVRHKVTQALPQKSEDFFVDADEVKDLWGGEEQPRSAGGFFDNGASDIESTDASSLYSFNTEGDGGGESIEEPFVYEGNEPVVEVPRQDEIVSDGVDLALLENAARKNEEPKKKAAQKSAKNSKNTGAIGNSQSGSSAPLANKDFSQSGSSAKSRPINSGNSGKNNLQNEGNENEEALPQSSAQSTSYEDTSYLDGNNLDTAELLTSAQELFKEKKFDDAFSQVKKFLMFATQRVDEGLFLKAQLLETRNTTFQDIKAAIKNYEMVTQRFPQSNLWDAAKKRAVYLKRFYVRIY